MNEREAIERIQDHMRVHRIGEYTHSKIREALVKAMDALTDADEAGQDIELLAGMDVSGTKCNICAFNPNDTGCELDGSQFDDDGECHFKWRRTKWATSALRVQQERENPQPNEKLLTESDIRSMDGDVIVVVSTSLSGKTTVRKVVVDIFDYKEDHCLIVWKFNVRNDTRYLSAMEKHCLLLPFAELGHSWIAYAHEPKEDCPTFWGEPKGEQS